MQPVNVGAVDLNLLKVLDAVLSERSVSAAGRRVGLSQPATSHALRRLRELLGDPLLIRGTNGFELTPHAQALQQPVSQALAATADAFRRPERFDPARSRHTFRLAATDLTALAILPCVIASLAQEGSGISLVCRSGDQAQVLGWLRQGELDMALGVYPAPPADMAREALLEMDFVILLRQGHPLLEGEITPARLAAFPAILVSASGERRGFMDTALERHGLKRRVAVTVPHFLLAPYLIGDSDLTLVFPRTLALELGARLGLAVRPLPVEPARFHVQMMWSRRHEGHAPLVWLRELIRKVARHPGDGRPA